MSTTSGRLARERPAGDVWGGLASALVALPSSVAFGVAIYSVLGPEAAARGAMAGIVGAVILGLIAPALGGTARLISAPCAPAAAVMGALAADLVANGTPGDRAVLLLVIAALLSGGLQILYGALGGGTLIKYIPYPVVTGYLAGVGVVILIKQFPGLLGYPKGTALWKGISSPELWTWTYVAVGGATIVCMGFVSRYAKAVPSAIIGLAGGLLAYFGLGMFRPELLVLEGNHEVIGPIGRIGAAYFSDAASQWTSIASVRLAELSAILVPSLTLSVLLSIDTLKTCVVVDALTRTRHRSNRELVGQGVANIASALAGGMPGAGTSGATLVNIASGGKTSRSGMVEGAIVLLALLLLGPLVAWIPVAALAGILVVVAFRMLDWKSLRLLTRRTTVLDFCVIATVVVTAVGVGLVAASGAGVGLAILLFIRDQTQSSVVRRRTYGDRVRSKQRRLQDQVLILQAKGDRIVILELQGNLFFGTTDQLYTVIEKELAARSREFVVLDLRRIQSLDYTGAHMLEQIAAMLEERGARLLLSGLPEHLPTGQAIRTYLTEVDLLGPDSRVELFGQISDALEWAEDRILEHEGALSGEESALDIRDFDFLKGRKKTTMRDFEACVVERSLAPGERVFREGDQGDELFLIRRGAVKVVLPVGGGKEHHLATFARGDFFGDMAFLDQGKRSADAIAIAPTELYLISRARFDEVADEHPRLGQQLFAGLARSLALRLRHADAEIRAIEEA